MTSTTVGLPDRYRPLEQVGPEEATNTGVITSWRAKDRVLNRDVAIRVHSPGGPAAHAWITRALTAGGLATPALAMVYDASEGSPDVQGGGVAYVVNEWIDGETLSERLTRGPLPDREARTVLRRLAEGVAEAHRAGLAVGGLTPDNVVLRPNGLVGLRSVPASTGSVTGDITALGALLEFALTGHTGDGGGARAPLSPDLAALVRRARSTEPGQGLSSAAAMAALLAERPRAGSIPRPSEAMRSSEGGRLRRARRGEDVEAAPPAGSGPAPTVQGGLPSPSPTPPTRPAVPLSQNAYPPMPENAPPAGQRPGGAHRYDATGEAARDGAGHDLGASGYAPLHALDPGLDDGRGHPYAYDPDYGSDYGSEYGPDDDDYGLADEPAGLENPTARRRLIVYGVPVLALAVVIGLAVWLGSSVLSVASSVSNKGTTPTVPAVSSAGSSRGSSTGSGHSSSAQQPTPGSVVPIVGASVFDPFGDGQPENSNDVPKSYDGDPATAWSTLQYRGSAAFGNLKPGVGVLYDLGSEQSLAGVTLTTTLAGATVDVRTGNAAGGPLDSYPVAATLALTGTDHVHFNTKVSARYVLIWVTQLVPTGGNFQANLAEVSIQHAG